MSPQDPFSAHEALDRCSLAVDFVDDNLLQHPYVQAHPEILAKIQLAADTLAEAYQLIGAENHAG